MTAVSRRIARVAIIIQRELAQIIQQEINDPRLPDLITISHVKVSKDIKYAKIFFTVLDKQDIQPTTSILNGAAKFLRTALSHTTKLKATPQLSFIYDSSLEYSTNLSKLIDASNVSPSNNKENE